MNTFLLVDEDTVFIDANGTAFGILGGKGDPGFTETADELGFYENSTRRGVILAAALVVAFSTGTLFSFPCVFCCLPRFVFGICG